MASEVNFATLRLRPGTAIQIQRYAIGAPRSEIQFLGSVPGKILMVTQKDWDSTQTPLELDQEYILSGFSGQYDFSFSSRVTQLLSDPFPYAALVYPESVSARLVRKLARIKTRLPAICSNLGGDTARDVVLADLTVGGALIDSPAPLGIPGDSIHLALTADLENYRTDVALLATIRHVHKSGLGRYSLGVEFRELTEDDKLVLHYVVHAWSEKEE